MNTFSVPNTKEATTVEKKSFKKYYLEMVFKFASAKSIAMDVHAAREKLMDYLEENPTVAAAIFEKSQAQRVALAEPFADTSPCTAGINDGKQRRD